MEQQILLVNLWRILGDNEKVIYKKGEAGKGEIVIIKRVDLSVKYLVKRIIAVEGDTLEIKDNELYLNNEVVNEPYIKEKMESTDYNKITIPTGKVFVMGDNRNKSVDSRSSTIGLIDVKDIEGKVIFKLPFFNKIQQSLFYEHNFYMLICILDILHRNKNERFRYTLNELEYLV